MNHDIDKNKTRYSLPMKRGSDGPSQRRLAYAGRADQTKYRPLAIRKQRSHRNVLYNPLFHLPWVESGGGRRWGVGGCAHAHDVIVINA